MAITSVFPCFLIAILIFLISKLIVKHNHFYQKAVEISSMSYYEALDGLRGILALGVFFHHSVMNYYYFQTGYFGNELSRFYDFLGQAAIALFFMITGFLFWSKAIKGRLSISKNELKRFYTNRFLRIYPLYWASLILVVVIIGFVSGFSLKNSSSGLLYELIRLSSLLSFVFINGSHGPTSINTISILPVNSGVQWTLVYEVQFYLILPFLAFFVKPKRFSILAGALLTFYAFHPSRHVAIIINFLYGSIAAYLVNIIGKTQFNKNSHFVSLAIIFLLLIIVQCFEGDYLTNPFVSLGLLAIFTLIASGNTIFNLLKQPFLRYLGIVSYSIYLFHGIILFFTFNTVNLFFPIKNLDAWSFWLLTLISGSLVISIAGLTYRFIEYPFLTVKASDINTLDKNNFHKVL